MADFFTLNLTNGLQYPYQVIHSKRAKYIRIKLSQKGELSVTLPAFTKLNFAHEFIRSKSNWIEKNLQKVNYQETNVLPKTLDLKLLDECWTLIYKETEDSLLADLSLVEKVGGIVELQGNPSQLSDQIIMARRLNNWCRKRRSWRRR